MADTSIEWTDTTWNPLRGCTRVGPDCIHCYAERQAIRHAGPGRPYEGLVRVHVGRDGRREPRWTGVVRFVPEKLTEPLHWTPRRVFVNSMSDLFHEDVPNEAIAAIFGVMAATPEITYQVLTKRPARAREWFEWYEGTSGAGASAYAAAFAAEEAIRRAQPLLAGAGALPSLWQAREREDWPLSNVWIGVSVCDQATAAARLPILFDVPSALRWVSYEPAIGPADFTRLMAAAHGPCSHEHCDVPGLDWIVIGGESGPGARPFDLAWARSTIEACRDAGVPCFVKQLGARPIGAWEDLTRGQQAIGTSLRDRTTGRFDLRGRFEDRKGGDPSEWPEDLRVREWPR